MIITHIIQPRNTQKNFLHEKSTQTLLCTNKTAHNFTRTWAEHSTIIRSWMLKCNASAVVFVVAEKMLISQNM